LIVKQIQSGTAGIIGSLVGILTGTRTGFVRNVAVLSGGSAVAQLINVAIAPVLTRQYLPSHLGEFALFTVFINLATITASLRYEFAIVCARNDREAAQLTWCAFILALPVSAIATVVFFFLIRFSLFGYGSMPLYSVLLIAPALISTAAFSSLRYWLLRSENFGTISRSTVTQNVSRAVTQVGLGALAPSSAGLLLGEILGRSSGMTRMMRAAWPTLVREKAASRGRDFLQTLNRYRKFAVYSLPSSILETLAASISLPLIVTYYGISAGGSYALVWRALALPQILLTANIADAFYVRAASTWQKDPEALQPLIKKTAGVLLLVGAWPALGLVFLAPRIFEVIFGARWVEAGVLAACVAPSFLAHFVVNPLTRTVLVVERQELKFIYDVMSLIGPIVVFVVAHLRAWPLVMTVIALTSFKAASYIVYFLILLKVSSVRAMGARVTAA
jgi:O-antigen/teichoic acid export membrane protein